MTAVAPVVIRGKGIWVGWPGIHLDNPNEKIPESDPNDKTPTAGLLSSKVLVSDLSFHRQVDFAEFSSGGTALANYATAKRLCVPI